MRISDLSRHAGVPVSTVKFYIREGLLQPGTPSGRNQATYGEDHLQRLDLIRALRDVADLPLEVVRQVLDQVDRPWGEGDPILAAMHAVYAVPERDCTAAERAEVERVRSELEKLMRGVSWMTPHADEAYLYLDNLTDALLQIRKYVEPEFPAERIRDLAELAWGFSAVAFEGSEDRVPRQGDELVAPTRAAILGTILMEPMFAALTRSAMALRSMRISEGLPLPPAPVVRPPRA